jgi:hypothetical protein
LYCLCPSCQLVELIGGAIGILTPASALQRWQLTPERFVRALERELEFWLKTRPSKPPVEL